MSLPLLFLFSGQGSQYFQMGKSLYETDPCFRTWIDQGDRLLSSFLSLSLKEILYAPQTPKTRAFIETRWSHPALFLVQYALAQKLLSEGTLPSAFLGVSLGEFVAGSLAGVLSFEDALEAVVLQALLLEKHCPQGAMIAVLGDSSIFNEEKILQHYTALASINSSSHFVLSLRSENLGIIEDFLRKRALPFQRLAVSYAFHSPWIQEAQSFYLKAFQKFTLLPLRASWISSLSPVFLTHGSGNYFWDVIQAPLRFSETIRWLETQGCFYYLDLSPSATLATLLKPLLKSSSSRVESCMSPWGDKKNFSFKTKFLE